MYRAIKLVFALVIVDVSSGNLLEDDDDYYEDFETSRVGAALYADPNKTQCGDLLEIISNDKTEAGKEALAGILNVAAKLSGAEVIQAAVRAGTYKVKSIDGTVYNKKGEKEYSVVKAGASATSNVAGGVGLTCLLIGIGAILAAPFTAGTSVAAGIGAIAAVAAPVGLAAAAAGAAATLTSLGLKANEIREMGKYHQEKCKAWMVGAVKEAGVAAAASLVERIESLVEKYES